MLNIYRANLLVTFLAFAEMLNNKESHRLEWIIIILIGAEIAIGLTGLASGWVGGVPSVGH